MDINSGDDVQILAQGHWGVVVVAVDERGRGPAGEFLDGLGVKDRAKIDRWITYLAENGRITNSEKFKPVEGTNPKLFVFKSYQVRVYGFFHGKGRFYVTNGIIKKNRKINKKDATAIVKAQEVRLATVAHLSGSGT